LIDGLRRTAVTDDAAQIVRIVDGARDLVAVEWTSE
jgi:hypothetical protein